jgi:hypothetical protein
VGVFEASTSPLKECYAQTDTNVFQLSQPETFCGPADTEVLRNGARALLEQTSRDVGSCAALGGTADVTESSVLSYEYTDQAEFRCGFCFPRGPAPP